jgi:hypothetical protein
VEQDINTNINNFDDVKYYKHYNHHHYQETTNDKKMMSNEEEGKVQILAFHKAGTA